MYPVEHLVFMLEDPESVDEFINLDHEIWTMFLAEYPDFVSKQMWVNDNNPGEVHSIISWKTLEGWKAIPVEKLKFKDKEFHDNYTKGFKIIQRIHVEHNHGIHEYSTYVK